MNRNVYLYILVMAGVTYLIRLLPLTLIKKEIKNVYIKSFLYYVPYVTLSVMTFPAILHATASLWSGAAALAVAAALAYRGKSLFQVSLAGCGAVLVLELLMARALLSRMDWTTGTMKTATMPPAYPLLYRFMPPYTIPTFSATDE